MIPIHSEPKTYPGEPLERCCFCRTRTPLWTNLPERTPGGQVACCTPCSETHEPPEVPTKSEWCRKERELTGSIGGNLMGVRLG